jgi:hypothetical protein
VKVLLVVWAVDRVLSLILGDGRKAPGEQAPARAPALAGKSQQSVPLST